MNISEDKLTRAVSKGLLTRSQADALWSFLSANESDDKPRFQLAHFAYYFGALIVIASMVWFTNRAWEQFGGRGLLTIALAYAAVFIAVGYPLWFKKRMKIPGGLLFTCAVCMTPLAVYGFQRMTGFWLYGDPGVYHDFHVWIRGSWFLMELGTIAASLLALSFVRFPFLTAPLAFSLWYLSMDLVPLITGHADYSWVERRTVSLWFGVVMLLVTYFVDRRTKEDFSFWGYLFGLFAFWGALTMSHSDSELGKFGYFVINLGLMFLSLFLNRRAFIVFGAMGVMTYFGHLAWETFQDSLLFPFTLTLLGLAVIVLGVLYEKNSESIEKYFMDRLPGWLRQLRPTQRS